MTVQFIADNPRRRARPLLDQILSAGVDQIAIACAFCTAAGVELLLRHRDRLRALDSFVVIGASEPTDYAALSDLHAEIPGNLYIHWGALAPVERVKNGAALMHSKVFYARRGSECSLWTGSHNLTANATQGGNCEAAILLQGAATEQPFVDALRHLEACRDDAAVFDPLAPPPGSGANADILVIHAEASAAPTAPMPWRIHLCLNTAQCDDLLKMSGEVRVFLYPIGSLFAGWRNAAPFAAYAGAITGLNVTARNPRSRFGGTPAEWGAATSSIVESRGVLELGPGSIAGPLVTTQALLSIDQASNLEELLLSEAPKIAREPMVGRREVREVDGDMRQFFRAKSLVGNQLLHVHIAGMRRVISVPEEETRQMDFEKIQREIAPEHDLPIRLQPPSEARMERRHPFIVRARYRGEG